MEASEGHLDIEALQDLKEIMEAEFETLVNTFVADSSLKLEALDTAIQNNNADETRKIAHSLKGSSSNVCANRMSELARQLEGMARQNDLTRAQALHEQLNEEFSQVANQLENQL